MGGDEPGALEDVTDGIEDGVGDDDGPGMHIVVVRADEIAPVQATLADVGGHLGQI